MPPMSLTGLVTKVGAMNKTATVTVSRFMIHPVTKKRIERKKKYLTHDEANRLKKDDIVVIRNCPKLSARKAFTLEKIVRSPEAEREVARRLMAEELAKSAKATVIQQY